MLFDEVARVGTGLSLLEPELVEFERAFSPFVEDDESLLDLRFLLSPGMLDVSLIRASQSPSDERERNATRVLISTLQSQVAALILLSDFKKEETRETGVVLVDEEGAPDVADGRSAKVTDSKGCG